MFTIIKPERRQNIFLNPSAEGKLGYRVVNGTVSRSDARSHWGRRSWLVTPSGAGCYLELDAQAASNETHVLTIWAAGGEPTELRFGTGAAQPARVADDGEWSCYQAVFAGSQVSGGVTGRIYVNRATYLDDAQMEAGRIRSSSLNGSMGFGYRWNGTRDYATSERLRYFKRRLVSSGGIEKILDDGERVRVSLAHGVGVPPVRIRSAERETGDGEIHLDRTLEPRAIRLTIWLVEEDFDALLRLRAELIELLAPKDEIKLITDLGGVRQYITGSYQSGLELGEVFFSNEKITLNIMCADPGWIVEGQTVIPLTVSASLSTTYSTIRQMGQWQDLGSPGGAVRRYSETPDGAVYCGTYTDGPYGWVARRDGNVWTPLVRVSGGSKGVYAVKRSLDGKKLYFCGSFTTVALPNGSGSVAAANIAVLDLEANTLAALGSGLGADGYSLEWDPTGAVLYVGGPFTTAGGSSANYIAKYTVSGGTWAALGTGTDGAVYGLAIRRDGKLLVGGAFQTAGASASRVAGLAISNSGSGSLAGTVRWYCVVAYNGATAVARSNLVAATTAHPGDSLSWTSYGINISYDVYQLTLTGWAFVGHSATTSLTVTTTSTVQTPLNLSDEPGDVAGMGTIGTPYIALWDPATSTWESVGIYGFSGSVYDLWLDHDGLTLFAAGAFKYADLNDCNGVSWYNWTVWRNLGGGPSSGASLYAVRRMADGSVWAGGDATSFGGDTLAKYVGRWIGSLQAGAWVHTDLVLPDGATVWAIAESNEDVILGHNAGGTSTRGAVTEIDWDGDLEGYPQLWVTGPGTLYGFGSFEAAADVFTEYALADGEDLIFDLAQDAKTVTSSIHREIGYIVRPGSQLGEVCLLPGDSNSFWLLLTGAGSNTEVKLVGYPRRLSVERTGG
jgi:hypothetical protein